MKLNLQSDVEFDQRLYDRDQGDGVAQLAVAHLRLTGEVNGPVIEAVRQAKMPAAEEYTRRFLIGTKSHMEQVNENEAVFHLGADELSEPLSEALKKAHE